MVDVLQKIQAMLSSKSHDLDSIERTLTDGYAQALSLEAEKWRLERRLTEVAQEIDGNDTEAKARELSSLAERLDGNQGELERLRGVLADLRRHADGVRLAS
jgi:chromosome segregation ATPase